METQNSILELMVMHHALLEALFFDFKMKIGTNEQRDALYKFRWELDKHFLTEEKVIFPFREWNNEEMQQMIAHLLAEHNQMRGILDHFKENESIAGAEVEEFQRIITDHREDEEIRFYPKIDSDLSENEKKQIVFRVNENPVSL